nr:C2 calcium/lipid-binding domain, CaLB [Tanacetum cinerariifolium]
MTKVIKGEFEKLEDLKVEDVSLTCDTSFEIFNNGFNRMSGMDVDLFTYEVANIPCDSNKDDDSKQRMSHEVDDDMGYDPSDVAFTDWLGSKKFNYKTMDHYTKKALWIYWIRGDDEVELTDEEFSEYEDEVVKVYRISTNIFYFETPMYKTFKEFNYLLQIDPDLLRTLRDSRLMKNIKMIGSMNRTEMYHGLMRNHGLTLEFGLNLHHDDESSNDSWRRWENHEMTYHDHDEIEYENETHNERRELCKAHELSVLNIRRFKMIKYSFGQDEEYVVVKKMNMMIWQRQAMMHVEHTKKSFA